jgi:uncharacterized membrane protein
MASSNLGFSDVQSRILAPRCVYCHTHDHSWINNYQTVLSKMSEIMDRIQSSDPSFMMPPPGASPLSADEKGGLEHWMSQGGPLHPGQNNPSPQPPGPPTPPPGPVPPALGFAYVQQEVLRSKCLSCHHHTDSFDTFAHTQPLVPEMERRIHAIGTDDQMPPASKPQLTPEELQLLDDWIQSGAHETGPVIPPISTATETETETATTTLTTTESGTTTSTSSETKTTTATSTSTTTSSEKIDFAFVKAQVLQPKCLSCHHHSDDFDTYSDAKPLLTEMKTRIHSIGIAGQMPPVSRTQLTADELSLLDQWLGSGAPEN